jgi:hypothetical protein
MRHMIVSRVSLSIAAAAVIAALAFARFVTPRREPQPMASDAAVVNGAALFAARCSSCHVAGALNRALRNTTPTRRRELERFLEDHGDGTSEDDRHILDYLTSPHFPR